MAIRRDLFRPLQPQYGEDCVVRLDVIARGYKVVFQPNAVAYEKRIAHPKAELRARVRMTLRSFTGTLSRSGLLRLFDYPGIAWSILSHKMLRWLIPYFLLLTSRANLFLVDGFFYQLSLALQGFFYASAFICYSFYRRRIRVPLFSTVYAFCLMNLAILLGVTKAILGHRILAYQSEG